MRRFWALICAPMLALSLSGCATPSYSATFYDTFDTITTITAYTNTPAEFDEWRDILKEDLITYHRLFDIYHTYEDHPGNLCAVNAADGKPVTVDARVLALLTFGQEMHTLSQGKVNIAMGAVLTLWHEAREKAETEAASLPDTTALSDALTKIDCKDIELNTESRTVQLKNGVLLDVGAIGKGWALEQAAQRLEKAGCVGIINAGGNVRSLGQKPGSGHWTVRITHALESSSPSQDIRIGAHTAVATSGDYQRYYTVDGQRYAHLIDPQTGYPARHMRAVSVICDDAALADALSTTLFLMPIEEGIAFVNTLNGVEALFLDNEENWRYSAGFSAYLP
ncbi:MAG: FAD:protein FMN transferase [Clostridia bacterium]|nr:FAD:protein FMN transferase [Clostridia bacterium]